MRRVAVIAHYDANGIFDSYLKSLIDQLASLCEKVIIVSTSETSNKWISQFKNVEIFHRENIGYDFCSYKFGISQIRSLHLYHQLIVCNDSFYTLKNFSMAKILSGSSTVSDIVGITDNYQFSYHLQSYFLIFNQRSLNSSWFFSFWSKVQPIKNKMQIIWRYEIGLSQTALKAGLKLSAVYKPLDNKISNIKKHVANKLLGAVNPTHMNAAKIAKKFGVVKVDLFRLDISPKSIEKFVGRNDFNLPLIKNHIKRTNSYYSKQNILESKDSVSTSIFDYVATSGLKSKIAVVLHLYHIDLTQEINFHLDCIPENFDLYISICDYRELSGVADFFSGKANNLFITVSENQGRDVLPFITILKNIDHAQYTCMLKIHSKKSTYSAEGDAWRQKIFENLLPSSSQVKAVISKFELDTSTGIVAPFESYLSNEIYWGANKEKMVNVMQKISGNREVDLFFVGGTMFWFAPKSLKPLIKCIDLNSFEPEEGQQDGTMAHTIERLFTLSAINSGFYCHAIEDLNKSISAVDAYDNRVGVLKATVNSEGITTIENVQ